MTDKGLAKDIQTKNELQSGRDFDSVVLEKTIFSNVFEKDIRRVYIYKKSERVAKALHMVLPAFKDEKALKERIQRLAIEIVDASVLPPGDSRELLSRSLLTLSSVLSMAKSGGTLSGMNAGIIMREVHNLLEEVAGYEDPRLTLPEAPTLSAISKALPSEQGVSDRKSQKKSKSNDKGHKGQDILREKKNGRGEAIVSILQDKGPSFIKDISTLIRDVSEKTIQRELQTLVQTGKVKKTGERRWTVYELS